MAKKPNQTTNEQLDRIGRLLVRAAAEQDEVLSAASSEPETELRADAAGSAGDEEGAGGTEGFGD